MSHEPAGSPPRPFKRHTVLLEPSGWQFDAGDAQTVLIAAREAQIVLPSSCRNGTCRACMCQLRSGKIRYQIEWPGLSAEEKAAGLILPCVAFAESDLVLDNPHAVMR